MLFTNAGTDMNLHLSFCQWPKDNSKVLVFGYLKSDLDIKESSMTSSLPCYITVTAVPSLNGCQDCIKVAAGSFIIYESALLVKISFAHLRDQQAYLSNNNMYKKLVGLASI